MGDVNLLFSYLLLQILTMTKPKKKIGKMESTNSKFRPFRAGGNEVDPANIYPMYPDFTTKENRMKNRALKNTPVVDGRKLFRCRLRFALNVAKNFKTTPQTSHIGKTNILVSNFTMKSL